MGLAHDLARILSPDRVLTDGASLKTYDSDAYPIDHNSPSAVVLPTSTDEVQSIVRYCLANQIPFTPRGAGTGLSGGAMPAKEGVVISMKKMTQILEIDLPNRRLRAQAGIANQKLTDAVKADGFHFAPDPSSQTVSTLGGNIAENAGGPHTLKYGVTAGHILGVTTVTPLGEVMTLEGGAPGGPNLYTLGVVIGAEGMLGIVTEAWVRLTPLPAKTTTLLVSFPSIRAATECVSNIIRSGVVPAALEMMDENVMLAVREAFGLDFPGDAKALLIIECDGDADRVDHEIQTVRTTLAEALRIEEAESAADRARLWTARKKGIGAMGRLAPTIVTHDGVIPRSKLPEVLEFISEVASARELGVANIFHAGDGNLHPCFYFDGREPGRIEAVIEAGEQILRKCVEIGGSISGEHGIGTEKVDLIGLMFSSDDLRLQSMVRGIFGESELCNPCKVIPNQRGCVEHMRRWRGAAT